MYTLPQWDKTASRHNHFPSNGLHVPDLSMAVSQAGVSSIGIDAIVDIFVLNFCLGVQLVEIIVDLCVGLNKKRPDKKGD